MDKTSVIIPAHNEEKSIPLVIKSIPNYVGQIIVVNNCSSDNTERVAKKNGAIVLNEDKKGYGYSCLKGIEYVNQQKIKPEIIVFLDGDYSDYPEEMDYLVNPISSNICDFVLGARNYSLRKKKSMTFQQIFGNWLAINLMRIFFKSKFSDLGPFRAIRLSTLNKLNMQDKTFGWTVEMQLKILKEKIPYQEVFVKYRPRIGVSKVSGTIKGTIFAGIKIISWIFKMYFSK